MTDRIQASLAAFDLMSNPEPKGLTVAKHTGLCPVCRRAIAVGDCIAYNQHFGKVLVHRMILDVNRGWAHSKCSHRVEASRNEATLHQLDRLMESS